MGRKRQFCHSSPASGSAVDLPAYGPKERWFESNRLRLLTVWQNACVERVIGSIRRECLDHIVIFNERHLRRVLSSYVDYYQRTRTHLSLDKDCPDLRPIQPPRIGRVVAIPKVAGLHHHYERLAA
jgi:hypothetical protein